jgi:hypothetical protein
MKNTFSILPVLAISVSALFYSCIASEVGSATKNEKLHMKIKEQRDIINAEKLQAQQVLSLDERALVQNGKYRGPLAPVATSLLSLATDAVKKFIANDQKKYVANYQFGLNDLYFYDQLSNEGAFDPVGMQFNGFKLTRTFVNKEGITDTALIADFALDTVNSAEIINNSMFRIRLKNFELKYAKAKVASNDEKKLNMDFEITFVTSYVNSEGVIFDGIVLGKFFLLLRNAPLERKDPGYEAYYNKLKDSLLTGKSFIVPRSFGYHRETDGELRQGYSQGAYSIQVKVSESSKNNFINKLVIQNASLFIDAGRDQIKSKF